jgi:hypothetical protein
LDGGCSSDDGVKLFRIDGHRFVAEFLEHGGPLLYH